MFIFKFCLYTIKAVQKRTHKQSCSTKNTVFIWPSDEWKKDSDANFHSTSCLLYFFPYSSTVCDWVFTMVDKLRQNSQFQKVKVGDKDSEERRHSDKINVENIVLTAQEKPQSAEKVPKSLKNSASDGDCDKMLPFANDSAIVVCSNKKTDEVEGDMNLLREMFPDLPEACLQRVHKQCKGNMDKTIQKLLDFAEQKEKTEVSFLWFILNRVLFRRGRGRGHLLPLANLRPPLELHVVSDLLYTKVYSFAPPLEFLFCPPHTKF